MSNNLDSGHPEKLYAYLDEGGDISLSPTKPDGQWAEYEHGPSDILAEYYELQAFSEPSDQIYRLCPTYFHVEINTLGDYFIL